MIGLDIGSHSIKLVGLKMTSQGPFLTRAGIKEIPYGREPKDLAHISEIIKALFREVGLKPSKVSLTVSGSGVHIKRITIPSMPKAELKNAVRWEIKGHLPFPIESAQIDFQVLSEFLDDGIKKLDLIVVACPHHLIDQTLSIAEAAGLQPTHLDVGPLAHWNALLTWGQLEKEQDVALVDLGAEKTGIFLFHQGVLQFGREVTPAGADITRAIMEGIESQEEPHLLYDRAESIKREVGIPAEADHEGAAYEGILLSKISFWVRPILEKLAAEIRRSLDYYYQNQVNVERMDRLFLTGGGANLKNISAYLTHELRLPAEEFNPFKDIPHDSIKIDPRFLQSLGQKGSRFTLAAGVALPKFKRIELLPAKEPVWSRIRLEKWIPILSPLIVLFVFLCIFWSMNGQEVAIQKELDQKTARVQALETLQAKLKFLKEKEIQTKQDLSLFPSSVMAPVPFGEVLSQVGHMMPDNVALSLLILQFKAKPPKGESQVNGGRELRITGLAFGSDSHRLRALAQIIERLEKSPKLDNAKLLSAHENKLYSQPGTEFEIVCDLATSG